MTLRSPYKNTAVQSKSGGIFFCDKDDIPIVKPRLDGPLVTEKEESQE